MATTKRPCSKSKSPNRAKGRGEEGSCDSSQSWAYRIEQFGQLEHHEPPGDGDKSSWYAGRRIVDRLAKEVVSTKVGHSSAFDEKVRWQNHHQNVVRDDESFDSIGRPIFHIIWAKHFDEVDVRCNYRQNRQRWVHERIVLRSRIRFAHHPSIQFVRATYHLRHHVNLKKGFRLSNDFDLIWFDLIFFLLRNQSQTRG